MREWLALFQQRPTHDSGNMFHRDWWQPYDLGTLQAQGLKPSFTFVDSSFKTGVENDFSVAATWAWAGGRAYLMDLWRERVEFPTLVATMRDIYSKWHVPIVIEDKASGQSLIQVLGQPLADQPHIPIIAQPIEGNQSKTSRAERITRWVEAKAVYLPAGAPWRHDFIEEHAEFPNGKHDDQVDTTSMALRRFFIGGQRPTDYPEIRYADSQPRRIVSRWLAGIKERKKLAADAYYESLQQ